MLFISTFSFLFLSLVLVVVLGVFLVSWWSPLFYLWLLLLGGSLSGLVWIFRLKFAGGDLLLFMEGLPLLVMGNGYGLFIINECCAFPSGNSLGFNSLLLLAFNSWGFEDICNFTPIFWIIKYCFNSLYCGEFFCYNWFYCYTNPYHLYGWLLQSDYGGFMWYWSGTLKPIFLANYNFFWVYYYASIFVSLKEVFFLLLFSSHHSILGFTILYFYYYLFLNWKVFFFVAGQIEVLFSGSINFDEGLSFCSFILSLLFWARSPCRPSMFLGYLVFLVSSETSAHSFYFLFWIVSLRSSSELKVPFSTL